MTARVDPTLLHLRDEQRSLREAQGADASLPRRDVIVAFTGELAAIEALGFRTSTVLGKIATGWLPIDALDAFIESPEVRTRCPRRPTSLPVSTRAFPTSTPTRYAPAHSISTAPA